MTKLGIVLVVLALCGCAAQQPDRGLTQSENAFKPQHHAIYVDEFGNVKHLLPTAKDDAPKNFADQLVEEQLYVDEILENYRLKNKAYREKNPNKLDLRFTLFIHGGLNTLSNTRQRTNLFSETMLDEGYYPVFVGWNSGPFTNYFDHLFRVRKGERRPVLAGLSMPFVFLEDVGRSLVHIPAAWYGSVMDPLTVMKSVVVKPEKDFSKRMDRLKNRKFNVNSNGPFEGVGSSYVTILNPVKLLTAPFVDGLGAGSWDSMLRRTDLVLSRALAFEGEIEGATPDNFADTALTTLLKKLESTKVRQPDGSEQSLRVNLISHSMGTIVANNILARHPAVRIDNVVFMGAAVRIKDVENGVVPWLLRENNEAKFYSLSLDPYREIGENVYYDFLPRGSLLHWIDNIFGEVNSFKDRTAGSWWNIVRTAEDVFPQAVRHRVYLTRFPIGDEKMGPQTHGEFDDYYFWRESFWTAAQEQRKFIPKNSAH